jgi:hypothetical protein
LNRDLLLLLLDKLLLGGLFAAASWWGAKILSHHQARRALHDDITKERVRQIASVWNDIGRVHELVIECYHRSPKAKKGVYRPAEDDPAILRETHDALADLAKIVEAKRFWLGERLHSIAFREVVKLGLAHRDILRGVRGYGDSDVNWTNVPEASLETAVDQQMQFRDFVRVLKPSVSIDTLLRELDGA